MGHKKRNPVARAKQPPAPASEPLSGGAAADNGVTPSAEAERRASSGIPSPNPVKVAKAESLSLANQSDGGGGGGVGSASFAAARLECERALTALRRGNHTKALRLMKESCQRNESSPHYALIQRVQGTVCVKVASIIDDPTAKNRHLRNALEAARRAVELSPNSIEFAHFYANLLYEVASEAKEYEDAVRECERGLAIENPIDPAKDTLQEEGQQKAETVEARIGQVQNDLRQLIQRSNIASISSWMKNLGNGDEKFRLIPIRRLAEDPMEVRLVQARRPNEIKKATKTPEERRKEIEVRVAAARLIQQKSEAPQSESELDLSMVSGPRVGDKRRSVNARKNGSLAENRDFVRSFWNSISIDAKRELLRINVSDMKEHFGSSKDGLANEVLSEALLFAETKRTWKFWDCCKCSERSADSESHIRHLVNEHMGTLLPKLQSVVPQIVDDEWVEMLLNGSWKPLDVSAAAVMLRNQSECKDKELAEDFCLVDRVGDGDFKETWVSSLEKGNLEESCTDSNVGSTNDEKTPEIEPTECREENRSVPCSTLVESWPVCDDSERAKLLERIHSMLEVLIERKCLSGSHLTKIIQYTIDELQSIPSGSQLLNHGVEQTPMCICFLGDAQLWKILKFLQDISIACGFGRYPEKSNNVMEDANTVNRTPEIKERIVLSADSSVLLLDESLLSPESNPSSSNHDAVNNVAGENSAIDINSNGVIADCSGLLSWIFGGPTSTEELAAWTRTKEEKARQGAEVLQMIDKEFYLLQSLCEQKCEHVAREEALLEMEDLCVEEGKKRENTTDFLHQSFESVLKKRREELLERENDEMFPNSRIELDAISQVLKEAENVSVNQYGLEEAYGGVNSHLGDLESGEDDGWRAKDYLQQVDTCIEAAFRKQKEQLYEELSKIDARLLRSVTLMQQLELKLEPLAAHDFRSILLPLVKSYLRAHLDDLAEKDATEKSDAVREELLAELARDSKKVAKGGNDNSRQTQEKTKDKKRNKDYKKPKDSKVTFSSETQVLPHETDESISPIAIESGVDHPDSEFGVSVIADDSKRQEEELRRRIELEAEERKLEETLEYQRRIEDEAKQKHLAEQLKKSNQTYIEKAAEEMDDLRLTSKPVDSSVHEQLKPSIQEDLSNNLNGFPTVMPNHSLPAAKSKTVSSTPTSGEHQRKIQRGLPDGGVSEDSYLPAERRVGKRGRRQKSSAKVSDIVPSAKENVEVGSSGLEGGLKEGDVGAKSLRQLKTEDDEEERYLADFEKAVQQSLDTFEAHKKFPAVSSLKTLPRISGAVDNGDVVSNVQGGNESNGDTFGTGLKNEVGEYNCFLNVIIQSLWHIKRFRDEFLLRSTSGHIHVGEPCVICALSDIFSALSIASADTRKEAVAPTSLRVALSNLYPDSNFFQEAQMNDASEVLAVIFDCLHRSFTPSSSVSDTESVASSCMGSWDCTNNSCIAHSIFGMDIFERMNCYNCGLESRHLKYTSFFHNINASALRTMKVMCSESSFDELLNLVEMNHQLACDPDTGGCGKPNYIHHILSSPPHVFTTVMGWQNTCESVDDIMSTLAALNTEIDISALYRGLDPKNTHGLVSVVCYYGQHYHCFAYSHDHGRWIMYDDKTVKVIGSWADVLDMCERGHLQPQVLFFEAVN